MSESTLRINKIKYSSSAGKIAIDYTRTRDQHIDDLTLVSDEEAAPEFYEALKKLTLPVCNILEVKDEDFTGRITPYGVTFHYDKEDVMGAVISCKLSIPEAGTEIAINTPMRKCQPDENANGIFFSAAMAKFLWNLESEGRKYVSGHRAQVTLFDEAGNAAEAESADNDAETIDAMLGHPGTMPDPAVASAAQVIDFPQSAAH